MLKKLLFLSLFINSAALFAAPSVLLDIKWLDKHLKSSDIRIIDMSDDTQYQRFHIPGAVHLPYAAINTRTKKGVSLSVGKDHIIKILGLLGIKSNDHVVLYDDMGGLHASRLFWELENIGHKNISLLNGGLVKWVLAGKKVVAEAPEIKPVKYRVTDIKLARDNSVAIENILSSHFGDKNVLLDVRSKDEYTGHPRHPRSGHIPNAKWWEWQHAVNFDDAFKIQQPAVLRQQLSALGITQSDTPITLYCQSAHRASHSYFTLRQLGFTQVRIYDGSMSEYSQHKSAPLTKGLTP